MSFIQEAWRLVAPRRRLRNAERNAQILRRFSAVEADSAWHFLQATAHLPEPEQRRALFLAALEETHHAWLFRKLAGAGSGNNGSGKDGAGAGLPRASLIASRDDLPAFLAYAHVSEQTISHDFDAMADMPVPPELAAVLREIQADEAGHDSQMADLLRQIVPPSTDPARLIAQARRRRWRAQFERLGLTFSAVPWTVLLLPTYLVFGGLARLAGTGTRRAAQRALAGRDSGEAA